MQPRDGEHDPYRPSDAPPRPGYPPPPPPPQQSPYGPPPGYPPPPAAPPPSAPPAHSPYAPPPPQQSPYSQPPAPYGPPAQYGQPSQPSPYSDPSRYGQPPQYGAPPQYGQPAPPSSYEAQQYAGQAPQGQGYPGQQPYQGQSYQGQPYQGQPYQGQPYQAQRPAPKKLNKKMLAIGAGVVAVVVIAGGAGYASTHGTRELSHTAVEKSIENQSTDTSKSFRVITGVDCNGGKNMKVARNASFTCTADDNVKITVVIESASSNPDWVWAVD